MVCNEYKGYVWRTDVELAQQLKVSHCAFAAMKRRLSKKAGNKPGCTVDSRVVIDHYLNRREEAKQKLRTYRGITWNGSDQNLSKQLGQDENYAYFRRTRKHMTHEEIIDEYLDNSAGKPYRGYRHSTLVELSSEMKLSQSYVQSVCNRYQLRTPKQFIDWYLDEREAFEEITWRKKPIEEEEKTHRGFTWKSYADLSMQLRGYRGYVTKMIHQYGFESEEEVIDYYLEHPNDKESLSKEVHNTYIHKYTGSYRGFTWTSRADLSKQLKGYDSYVTKMIHQYGFRSDEEVIDFYLDHPEENGNIRRAKSGSYRGYTWKSHSDLSTQLGHSANYVCVILTRCPNMTPADIIDAHLGNTTKREKKKKKSGSYRGYTWTSFADLSYQLGHDQNYVSSTLLRCPDRTIEDLIDMHIDRRK